MDWDHFIAPIIDGSGKLITDIDTESTTVVEHTMAFAPHEVEMVDIGLVTVVETDLIGGAIVFQLPIRGRSDDQMDTLILHFVHASAVALDNRVMGHGGTKKRNGGGHLLFVVVMAFDINDEHGDRLVVDVIDDAVVCRDAS